MAIPLASTRPASHISGWEQRHFMKREDFRMYETLNHYIDGKWVEPTGAKSQDVMNPAKDIALGKLGHASKGDLDKAIAAAEKGFQVWRKTSAYDRGKILRK